MSRKVTLEEVERLASQLPSPERLKLVTRICNQLGAATRATGEKVHRERMAQVDAWLEECDAVAESIQGQFDAAEDIRRIREERANRL